METAGNETFDRIQREIQEALQREKELRQKYNLLNNNEPEEHTNGYKTPSPEPAATPRTSATNGFDRDSSKNARKFVQNSSTKGVMQKFLRMHGKMSLVALKPKAEPQRVWIPDVTLEPAKVTMGAGKMVRNGFIPAEEKMKRELQEFQRREDELRRERKKSQPDLMAALEQEQEMEKMKPGRSVSLVYSGDHTRGPSNGLKRARSLSELLDGDEEVEELNTYSLIKQFEKMSQS